MLIVCFVSIFVVCFSSTLSPCPDRSVRSGNNLMRLAIIQQLAIMAYHVQIVPHELHVISRLHSRRVRKSCCRPIETFVRVTLVLLTSSKMRKSRHLRKFQTMINSSMRKLHYGPLTLRRTNVHLDSYSLTIAYTLLPGDHCSLLSRSGCQTDGMLQN